MREMYDGVFEISIFVSQLILPFPWSLLTEMKKMTWVHKEDYDGWSSCQVVHYMMIHLPFSAQGLLFLSGAWINGSVFSCSSMYSLILHERKKNSRHLKPVLSCFDYVFVLDMSTLNVIYFHIETSRKRVVWIRSVARISRMRKAPRSDENKALLSDRSIVRQHDQYSTSKSN